MTDCPRCDAFENDAYMAKSALVAMRRENETLAVNLRACQVKVSTQAGEIRELKAHLARMMGDREFTP